jgi:hypothetical protein
MNSTVLHTYYDVECVMYFGNSLSVQSQLGSAGAIQAQEYVRYDSDQELPICNHRMRILEATVPANITVNDATHIVCCIPLQPDPLTYDYTKT